MRYCGNTGIVVLNTIFIERVPSDRLYIGYILPFFNAGDSLLHEAWTGFNEAGLAIMNTASYNLAPDTQNKRP